MGGAAGHISHLYENRSLKFSELKAILKAAAKGKLEHVTEKLDGQALTFSWDASAGRLLVARAAGDIGRGGMTGDDLAKKFQDRPWIARTFVSAFKILSSAMTAIPDDVKERIFGAAAQKWYSIEVIYVRNPNVINYDQNSIVFHEEPVFDRSSKGVKKVEGLAGSKLLARYVGRMQDAVASHGWKLQEPVMVRLQGISDGSVLRETLDQVEELQNVGRVPDDGTIGDYLRNLTDEVVADLALPKKVARAVVDRILELPGCPTLTQIKQMTAPDVVGPVAELVRSGDTLLKKFIKPLEMIIHRFSVDLLKGVQSALVNDGTAEVKLLRKRLKAAISSIESSDDEAAISTLHQNMQKLGSINDVNTSVEGIVFVYRGHAYKFTGSFAPMNQILGMFKYDRPPSRSSMDETILRSAIENLLHKAPRL